jgi:hypothetical protein
MICRNRQSKYSPGRNSLFGYGAPGSLELVPLLLCLQLRQTTSVLPK